ncbi:MAG: hypothetical protein ACK2UX_06510, partial [Anaerolineae bacterium]
RFGRHTVEKTSEDPLPFVLKSSKKNIVHPEGNAIDHEPVLQEGRRIGEFYGQQSAENSISLVDTVRALFFFRESLLRAAKPGQINPGQYDAEDVRIHRQLRHFMDEVMYACLASYEATCYHLLSAGNVQ